MRDVIVTADSQNFRATVIHRTVVLFGSFRSLVQTGASVFDITT